MIIIFIHRITLKKGVQFTFSYHCFRIFLSFSHSCAKEKRSILPCSHVRELSLNADMIFHYLDTLLSEFWRPGSPGSNTLVYLNFLQIQDLLTGTPAQEISKGDRSYKLGTKSCNVTPKYMNWYIFLATHLSSMQTFYAWSDKIINKWLPLTKATAPFLDGWKCIASTVRFPS